MKDFMWKAILFTILCIFIYRNRNYLLRLVLGVECLRHLGARINFKWLDVRDWMKHLKNENEIDHA